MSEGTPLPDSWITVKVSDVGVSVTGNTPSTKYAENYGGTIPYIKPPQLTDRPIMNSKEFLSDHGAKLARILPPFSVLVSCIGNLGKTGINNTPVAFNQQINAIIPFKGISSSFLFYQTQSHSFRSQLESKATATTISIVNKGNFETVELNIASLNEQTRIVAKIEELFSELDKGVESLKAAREQLKVYRQSVLKDAFEGRLTESWRNECAAYVHGNTNAASTGCTGATELESTDELLARIKVERQTRYVAQLGEWQQAVESWEAEGKLGKKPSKPQKPKEFPPITSLELTDLSILPKGWGWANFRNIYAEASLGKMLDKQKNTGDLKPYLRNKSVRWGSFDLSDITEMRFESDEYERYGLEAGDLIICEGGEPGRCAIWKAQNSEMRIQKALHRVRFFNDTIHGNYAMSFISYSALNGHLARFFTGTTIKHLTGKGLQDFQIPICSPEEQHQIVQEIETRFSVVEKMEQTIDESLQKAEVLRQSILKRAFEGKLVPQDENDEPASELLSRIRAERAAVAPAPKRGRKKA